MELMNRKNNPQQIKKKKNERKEGEKEGKSNGLMTVAHCSNGWYV